MERRVWRRPLTMVQKFEANEYVAACENGTTYLFTCNAGGGKSGNVYLETNGQPGLQKGWFGDESLGGYHACGTTHEADSDDAFLNGYYVTEEYEGNWPWGEWVEKVTEVIVWRGPNNDNVHCTTELDKSDWELGYS